MRHSPSVWTLLAASAALVVAMGTASAQAQVTLRYLVGSEPTNVATADGLKAAFEAANPDIKIEVETIPANDPNYVKTQLATGSAADVIRYNAGSLFQGLNPPVTLVDLTNEPWQANVIDSFKAVVTAPDGLIYGAPEEASMAGGILYNKRIYEKLGLSVPTTWDEFMANNQKIKDAGIVPVIQTYGTTWTSQLFVLADYFNVQAKDPHFADRYTAGEAKYATEPAAIRGFQKLQAVHDAGFLNEDYGAATFEEGLRKLAVGEGAHYPMLTFAVGAIETQNPDEVDDVGFFALPGDDAASNGLTVWMPSAVYITKATAHLEEAKKFVAFIASVDGCNIRTAAHGATGPYLIKGCELPADVPTVVSDLLPYFEREGATAPALEYLSPIKGPSLEQITVEVGSGIRSAADAAALYDEDVRKQAQQLGLPGWN